MRAELIAYARQQVAAHGGNAADLATLVLIGSQAYPEFARPNSDIDLIAVDAGPTAEEGVVLDHVCVDGRERLVEFRRFSPDGFRAYALTCETPKLFAFVRGYRILLDMPGSGSAATIDLAIGRYFTDASRLLAGLLETGLEAHLHSARFMMTDARNALSSERVRRQLLLVQLRLCEIAKDFIAVVWMAILLRKASPLERVGVDRTCPLLQEAGLLSVFLDARGGRMVDPEKYPKSPEITAVIAQVSHAATDIARGDIDAFFVALASIFAMQFQRELFIALESVRPATPVAVGLPS
ncbi:hypothetical protein ACJBUE_23180 (plasmid) [Ralstonia syzygii subsp. celebesensis]|uniref:Uncharacterized protein n=2 Tax=Ralstonia syzygii subsp. celebesensis TaxID=1310168 RepID=A0A1U9VLQ0_9RALS|nr:hypothetical protein [Ralstonia syzygii]AQW31632.1 hypothetical protein B0B51_16730 [blood disease bacterium A2-HR MARDI]QQV58218.1 hypothetical protein JK151_23065 [Ralstonia syzygii subsp. celebesensis]CCA83822.1 conserved hypothetical protein [blood disease bacterium R229]